MKGSRPPSNQELRTRKDLLLAAGRLLKQGRKPTMDEVAKEALVSRATAYRYFKNVDALLVEAPIDAAFGDDLPALFTQTAPDDAEKRVDEAEAYLHRIVYENEAQLRILLANAITRPLDGEGLPARQNRRTPLIEAALAPTRPRFHEEAYQRLCAALAMVFGPESMIVASDVIRIEPDAARQVKSWAVRTLVRAALQESEGSPPPATSSPP